MVWTRPVATVFLFNSPQYKAKVAMKFLRSSISLKTLVSIDLIQTLYYRTYTLLGKETNQLPSFTNVFSS